MWHGSNQAGQPDDGVRGQLALFRATLTGALDTG